MDCELAEVFLCNKPSASEHGFALLLRQEVIFITSLSFQAISSMPVPCCGYGIGAFSWGSVPASDANVTHCQKLCTFCCLEFLISFNNGKPATAKILTKCTPSRYLQAHDKKQAPDKKHSSTGLARPKQHSQTRPGCSARLGTALVWAEQTTRLVCESAP